MTGAMLCAECGWLDWRSSGDVSPHRQAADAHRDVSCPHCQACAWLDLRRDSTALVIREGEEGLAAAPSRTSDVLRSSALGVVAGTFLGVLATSSLVIGAAVAGLCGVAAGLAGLRLRRLSVAPARSLPDRWSLALPAHSDRVESLCGVPQCTEPLRAPISGRRCLAWEVGLRADDHADGDLASWALLEQRVASLVVQEHAVHPEETFVALKRTCVGPFSIESVDPPALEWLRDRGFTAVGSTLFLYESIVPLEAKVEVEVAEGTSTLRYEAPDSATRRPS